MTEESLGDRFVRLKHPDVWAARQVKHEFVPMPLTKDDKPDHVCNGGCYCQSCWERKADPPHPRRRRR